MDEEYEQRNVLVANSNGEEAKVSGRDDEVQDAGGREDRVEVSASRRKVSILI